MVAPNRSFNSRDPKAGHSRSLHGLPVCVLSNYGTVGNALKDPRVVFPAITPPLNPPPCIIASIDQPFHHTTSHGDCQIMTPLHRHRCMRRRSARDSGGLRSPMKTTTAIEPLDLSVLASDGPASQ